MVGGPDASSGWWPWARSGGASRTEREASMPAHAADAHASAQDVALPVPPERNVLHLPPYEEPKEPPLTVHLPLSTLLVSCAFGIGFASGVLGGARRTALVYLAENAHRLPRTVQGWYFYNKTKYYRMILGGVQQGGQTGLQLAGWTAGFCLIDVMAEHARQRWMLRHPAMAYNDDAQRPLVSYLGHWSDGTIAGSATALVAAIAFRFSRPVWLRAVLLGATAGGLTGALRDVRQSILEQSDPGRPHMI
ncbi:hypothetical protein GLX27_001262 [Malassezia furfur]|uniref:Uncharacterized protein n=1 Tax=Malassezia furfur TaxID=55194 RepID=A0ABY8EQB7_MALFU|nr:hypothetical protein GLX27_001262 [Malassezia furfur]